MPIFIPNDPTYGFLTFGDTDGTLGDRTHAGDQTIHDVDASISTTRVATQVGDARAMIDRAVGGDDDLLTTFRQNATVIGDSLLDMSDRARGGNDVIVSAAEFSASAFGDAGQTMSGRAQGGDDQITVRSDFAASAWGDARTLTDRAQGGDDHLGGVTPAHGALFLIGDGDLLSGRAKGGNDTLLGDDLLNTLIGDGRTLTDRAQGGDDVIIGKTQTPTFLPETNDMYGDGLTLSGRAHGGDDRLVSGQGATDHMWGDAATVSGRASGGADRFEFGADNGQDSIMDFQRGKDHVVLDDTGVDNFGELQGLIQDTADGLLIRFDAENSILLAGVHQVGAGDFLFT